MARFLMLARFRRRGAQPGAESAARDPSLQPLPRRLAPSPGALRRERRAILRAREERIRDLGGLVLEMYRQDRFREDLLVDSCQAVISLEERLNDLDLMLSSTAALRRATSGRCECGAPLIWGSHFCANCGRPAGAAPVVTCPNCGHPLPADARFCAACGHESPVEAVDDAAAYGTSGANGDQTMLVPPPDPNDSSSGDAPER